jgi:methyl-accepting chemotaxis protein
MSEELNSQKNQRQFKNFLISPSYQLRFIGLLVLSAGFLAALIATLSYVYLRENYEVLVKLSPMTEDARNLLYSELDQLMIRLSAMTLGFLILISVLGLILSHRSAGPLYHFKRVFQEIENGKHGSRVHLRPSDDFRDVATAFNSMMDQLHPAEPKSPDRR